MAIGAVGGAFLLLGASMPFGREGGNFFGGLAIAAAFVLLIIATHWGPAAREAGASLAGETELRVRESAVSRTLRAALALDALGGWWCRRVRAGLRRARTARRRNAPAVATRGRGGFDPDLDPGRSVACRNPRAPVPALAQQRALEDRALQPEQQHLAVEARPAVAGQGAAGARRSRRQGRTIGTGFRFMTVPTARAARGLPASCGERAVGGAAGRRGRGPSAVEARWRVEAPARRRTSGGEVEVACGGRRSTRRARAAARSTGRGGAEDARAVAGGRDRPPRATTSGSVVRRCGRGRGRRGGDEQPCRAACPRGGRRRRRARPSASGGGAEALGRAPGEMVTSASSRRRLHARRRPPGGRPTAVEPRARRRSPS